jgi:colicin import membrane protein
MSHYGALVSYEQEALVVSLSEQTRTGLREMPSNAAWLLSRVLKPAEAVGAAAGSATAGARERGRKVTTAVVDAVPIGGDSVDSRMKRAQEASERAREAEIHAAEAAHESKARSDYARVLSERGRARLKEVEREMARYVRQHVAEAQKAADEAVERERRAAESDAEEEQRQVRAEVDEEIEEARRDAEASRQHAEELVEDATEKLAEARRLADEAAEATRAAAEEANRQARNLADDAQQQAHDAEARVKATHQIRQQSRTTAKRAGRELDRDSSHGGLESYNKPELVKLAASIGIDKRTHMTKGELADAIAKASRSTR